MPTYNPKANEIERHWHVIDASGKTLGRLSCEVANLLRGKHKPEFTPNLDCGDYVVVINAETVKVTGKKEDQKLYRRHSGFPHGFKEETLRSLRERRPVAIIERSVRGMIPHTRLGDHQFTNLKVYAGVEHPHEAQKPKPYEMAIRLKEFARVEAEPQQGGVKAAKSDLKPKTEIRTQGESTGAEGAVKA